MNRDQSFSLNGLMDWHKRQGLKTGLVPYIWNWIEAKVKEERKQAVIETIKKISQNEGWEETETFYLNKLVGATQYEKYLLNNKT